MAPVIDPLKRAKKVLKINEIPNCGCRVVFRPLCQHTDPQGCNGPRCVTKARPLGCPVKVRTGKCKCKAKRCECPTVPGEPCRHILALREKFTKTLTFDEWQELMVETLPEQYVEPVPAERAEITINKAARVAMMEERASNHQAVRHRGDLQAEDRVVDRVSAKAVTRSNGSIPNRLKFAVQYGGSTSADQVLP